MTMRRILITLSLAALLIVPVARADFHAPSSGYWRYCGSGVWGWKGAEHYTSCPFARNVAAGVRRSSDFGSYKLIGDAYSPVTHRTYIVHCVRRGGYAYRCTAGVGAIVWIGY